MFLSCDIVSSGALVKRFRTMLGNEVSGCRERERNETVRGESRSRWWTEYMGITRSWNS